MSSCACEGQKISFHTTVSCLEADGKKRVKRKFQEQEVTKGDFEN
jgi:hypothetical protein